MTSKFVCAVVLVTGVTLLSGLRVMGHDTSSPQPVVGHAVKFAVSPPLARTGRTGATTTLRFPRSQPHPAHSDERLWICSRPG